MNIENCMRITLSDIFITLFQNGNCSNFSFPPMYLYTDYSIYWGDMHSADLMELQQYVERHGEADSERVSATVASFAPLIFNLPTTAGWEELSKVCQDVFSTFHRDTNLPSEWVSCNITNIDAVLYIQINIQINE